MEKKKTSGNNNNQGVKNGPKNGSRDLADTKEKQKSKGSNDKTDYSNVTLFTSPILSLKILVILLGRGFKASVQFMLSHLAAIIGLISLAAAF